MLTSFRKLDSDDVGNTFHSMPNLSGEKTDQQINFASSQYNISTPKKLSISKNTPPKQVESPGVTFNVPNAQADKSASTLFTTKANGRVKLRMGDGQSSKTPATIHSMFALTTKRAASQPALAYKRSTADREFYFITYQEYYNQCCMAAKSFIKLGLEPYHGVGILGFNSPEWFVANMGAIFAGGFAAGIYTTNSPEACQYVAHSCKANVIVVENHQQLKKILAVRNELPHLKAIVQYKDEVAVKDDFVYSWEDFLSIGKDISDSILIDRLSSQVPNQCCLLIYTSGTTGNPKGVMLSHDNITFTSLMAIDLIHLKWGQEHFISYLPLSHIAAQLADLYLPLCCAGCVYFADSDALKGSLATTLKEVRPTFFMGVPRVWEKFQEKMISVNRSITGIKRQLARWATGVGYKAGLAKMHGRSPPFNYGLADSMVLSKVRKALGLDRCKFCCTGAAPITKETLDYFLSFGIILYELYGMSETTGPHTTNYLNTFWVGSVGKEIGPNGTRIRLHSPDEEGNGEICMAGRNIFMGYLNEPEKTDEATDSDGWLYSGDVGRKDEKDFLFITGRIKELIITAGGENVAPVPIEDKVKESLSCISNCMLVGDKRKFLSLLLTFKTEIDENNEGLPLDKLTREAHDWCLKVGSNVTTVEEIRRQKDVNIYDAIQKGIDRANEFSVSRASKVAKWTILPRDFSIAGGELGPTLKLRRSIVTKMHKDIIDSLYAE